jgi:hypothetical protein
VWLRRSLAAALAIAFASGCSSDSKTYSTAEVTDALRNHGFSTHVVAQSETDEEFQEVFPHVAPEDLLNIVTQREGRPPPGGKGALVLSALIFKSQDKASCDEPNVIGACMRKGNVVVVVRDHRARAATEAVEDLS